MLFLVLAVLSYFRSEFQNESLAGFGFWSYSLALLPYGLLVVLSHLLCPDLENMTEPDMDAWYYAHAPDFFRGFALFVAVNAIIVNVIRGVPWLDPIRGVEALAIATAVLVSRSNNRRVHSVLIAFFYITLLASVKRWQ